MTQLRVIAEASKGKQHAVVNLLGIAAKPDGAHARSSGDKKIDAGVADTSGSVKTGNPVVPLGLRLPTDRLAPDSYRVELLAIDSAGHRTKASTADFELE